MSRLPSFYSAEQYFDRYPPADAAQRAEVEAIYRRNPWLHWHPHFTMYAHDPVLTDLVMDLTYYLMFEVPWTRRRERWHALLAMDKKLGSEDPYLSHLNSSHTRSDLSEAELVSLDFPDADVFGPAEQLMMRLADATLDGAVPDELFDAVHERYGDKETVECAVALGLWAFFIYVESALGVDPRSRPHTRAMWRSGWVHESLDFGAAMVERGVHEVVEAGRPLEEVAEELAVPTGALAAWVRAATSPDA